MKNSTVLKMHHSSKIFVEKLEALYLLSETMADSSLPTNSDFRLILLTQFTAAISMIVFSLITELRNNSFHGASYLLRSLIEAFINYKYIIEDKTQMRARAFIADDIKSRIKSIGRIIALLENDKSPSLSQTNSLNEYRQKLSELDSEINVMEKKYGKPTINFYTLEKRAIESKTTEMYATVYWLLCQDTHLTARGLDKYLKHSKDGLLITWDINIDNFNALLKTCTLIYATFLFECNKYFKTPNLASLDVIVSDFYPKF